eukprot:5564995-Amphidinium_carterae.1
MARADTVVTRYTVGVEWGCFADAQEPHGTPTSQRRQQQDWLRWLCKVVKRPRFLQNLEGRPALTGVRRLPAPSSNRSSLNWAGGSTECKNRGVRGEPASPMQAP